MSHFYRYAADALVIFHGAYALTILLGLMLILIGGWRSWSWVRNLKFRIVHLAMILIVVFESWLGITCPLTTWEKQLREKAGDAAYEGQFIANWVHEALFVEISESTLAVFYTAFGAIVVLSWLLVPPQRKQRQTGPLESRSQPQTSLPKNPLTTPQSDANQPHA